MRVRPSPERHAHWLRGAALVTLGGLLGCAEWEQHPQARQFYTTVDGLSLGATEKEVLLQLGPPDDRGGEFYLGQAEGFEAEYRAAAASGSVRWVFWRRGIADDVVCAVGFGSDDRVTFKACGGT